MRSFLRHVLRKIMPHCRCLESRACAWNHGSRDSKLLANRIARFEIYFLNLKNSKALTVIRMVFVFAIRTMQVESPRTANGDSRHLSRRARKRKTGNVKFFIECFGGGIEGGEIRLQFCSSPGPFFMQQNEPFLP